MTNKEEKIHKYNLFYKILRFLAMFGVSNYYRRIQIIGKENIPYGSRFIITPNHQNALMDAMAVLYSVEEKDIIFVARADIFKKKSQKKILTLFKMLPIYRIRDGVQELSKNEEIFERSVRILTAQVPVCLMPEGNHGDKRKLRNFVKGAFRIAFRAQELTGEEESLKILPVGLDYKHYQKYYTDLLIVIGEPINVIDYMDDYNESQPKGLNTLRDRVAEEMKKLMIHISNDELYDLYQDMRHIWNSRMRKMIGIRGESLFDQFKADKVMIRIFDSKYDTEPDALRSLAEKTSSYIKNLKALNMRNKVIEKRGGSFISMIIPFILLLVTFPVAFYGFINNWFPFNIPVRKTRNIKDKQFQSSFKFVFSLMLFPVFYIVQSVLVGIFTAPAWIGWAYFISLPLSGYCALYWSFYYKKLRSSFFFKWLETREDPVLHQTVKLHSEIIDSMTAICKEYLDKIPLQEDKLRYV